MVAIESKKRYAQTEILEKVTTHGTRTATKDNVLQGEERRREELMVLVYGEDSARIGTGKMLDRAEDYRDE